MSVPTPPPLPVAVPDVHCHLDLMDGSVAAAVEAAAAAGVRPLVTIGIDVASSGWAARAAAEHDGVYAAVAIHPNEAPEHADERAWAQIAELAAQPKVVAIGETGLDRFRTPAGGWPAQEESFRRHIQIAKQLDKTLVIHDRDAHDEVLRVLDEEGAPARTVLHCFSGDAGFARACAERGFFASFAGNVTFKNAQQLRDAAAVTPVELLLVETDAPFLTPVPHRGQPNAPRLVPLTVRALAEVKQLAEAELAAALAANASRAFAAW